MAAEKIDMSLDDIIKLNRGGGRGGRGRGRGVGRGGRGGSQRGAGGRGASVTFRGGRGVGRGGPRFNTRGRGGSGVGGVVRGGVQKRSRGVGQQQFTRALMEGVWQHDLYQQSAGRMQGLTAGGDASARLGKLLISNLDFGVNDSDIKELFAEFGVLRKAAVHYDRTGRSLGTAEVTYSMRQEAVRAMNQYNNVPLDGRPMKIQLVGGNEAPVASRITMPRGQPRGAGTRGFVQRGRGVGGRGFGGRGRGFGGQQRFGGRGRGVGRGRGRGRGAGKMPSKDELDAQLDAYNAKMDTE